MVGLSISEWKKGQQGSGVKDVRIDQRVTTPPAPYTEGTLNDAMKGAGALVADPKLRAALKDKNGDPAGIGTGATRAAIVERLKEVGFLRTEKVKKKVYLRSSESGRHLIAHVPQLLTDPTTTAIWEQMLEMVSRGEMPPDAFLGRQIEMVKKLVGEALQAGSDMAVKQGAVACEKAGCSGGGCLSKRKSKFGDGFFWACSKEGCSNVFEDTKEGPVMKVREEIEALSGHGNACPKCGKGKLVTKRVSNKTSKSFGKSFLACDAYPGCKYSEWPD